MAVTIPVCSQHGSGRPGGYPPFIDAAIPGLFGRVGPFLRLDYQRCPPDYDFLHAMVVRLPASAGLEEGLAAGGGLTPCRARTAALGEAIERSALRHGGRRQTRLARVDDPSLGRHVDPAALLHYPPEAYEDAGLGLRHYQPSDRLRWVEGRRLRDGASVWVPAFAVFPARPDDVDAESPHDALLSTGTACASDLETATLSGLYEVVERDAFMLHWENCWSGTLQPLPSEVEDLSRHLAQKGFTLVVRRLRTDIDAAVAVAVVLDERGGRAAAAFGAAARASWSAAAYRAAEEAILSSFWVTSMHSLGAVPIERIWAEMSGLPVAAWHAALYGFPHMTGRAAFLWEDARAEPSLSSRREEIADSRDGTAADLRRLVERVSAAGGDPVVVDMTDDLARACGCVVVRVVVPGFVALARGLKARPLLNPRLVTVAQKLGRPHRAPMFNPDPHPFP